MARILMWVTSVLLVVAGGIGAAPARCMAAGQFQDSGLVPQRAPTMADDRRRQLLNLSLLAALKIEVVLTLSLLPLLGAAGLARRLYRPLTRCRLYCKNKEGLPLAMDFSVGACRLRANRNGVTGRLPRSWAGKQVRVHDPVTGRELLTFCLTYRILDQDMDITITM